MNTKFAKHSILGKPPSSIPKLYAVTPLPKSKAIPNIDESHALSKPVTSNSVPTPTESKVVKNDNVISSGIFRINPFKASRVLAFKAGRKHRSKIGLEGEHLKLYDSNALKFAIVDGLSGDEPVALDMPHMGKGLAWLNWEGTKDIGPAPTNNCVSVLAEKRGTSDICSTCKIQDGYNPATWMLEISTSAQELIFGHALIKTAYRGRRNKDLIAELSIPHSGTQDLYFPTRYSQSFFCPVYCLPLETTVLDINGPFYSCIAAIVDKGKRKSIALRDDELMTTMTSKKDPGLVYNTFCVDLSILATTLNKVERSIFKGIYKCYSMAGSEDDIPPPPPPPSQTPTQQTPHTVSTIKLPILKKGEYDIWAMKMEHYLAHTDYPIWEVIQRGNGPVSVSTDTNGLIKVLPPKTAEEILARERERKARTTLLMALPEDHLAKFHKMTDAKEMWEAIKSRFGGNDESKKMQKYILKQQFEGFSVSNSEGLHKGYDRFQSLLSQLEIHGAGVSTEDANQKFLRSLPSAWSQVSLIMRTKPGVDSLSFDDLYNNLRVFESDVKGSTASSSSTQNVAFVSENTSSTNDVSTAYGVSNSSGHNSQYEHPSSYSLLANQSSCPQLDHEDLEQLDEFDLEEMDLKWQVAMISMRMKKFYKKTGRKLQFDAKEPVGFDKTKVECYSCHKTGHFARECRSKGNQDSRRRDAWNTGNKDKENGRRSGLDTEREQLGDASIEIQAYTQALKKVEAQLVAHQQSQLWYEEKIRFMKIDLDDKTDVLTYHKKLQMSAKDKAELGYGNQMNKSVLSYENKVFQSVFVSRTSDIEDSPVNDRYAEGMHAVPPPMTGIYILSRPDKEIDDSQFIYGPKQSKPSESDARSSDFNSCKSNCSVETYESMPEPVVNEPKVVSEPKVWCDAPIIEEYESDSEDEHVSLPTKEQKIPSFSFINTDKHVKTPRKTVIEQNTCSQSPKPDKKDCSGLMSKKWVWDLGIPKSHVLMSKGSSQREIRPVWNNVQRMNHQNQFVPKAVLTRTGNIPVNTARTSGTNTVNIAMHNFNSHAVPINAARKVNTVKPIVNNARPKAIFHKSVSPFRNSFNRTTALRVNFSKQKVNTAKVNAVSAVKGKRETADYPQRTLQNKGIVDSGCFRHMTGNKAYLAEYQDFNCGPVAFGGSKGYITGKASDEELGYIAEFNPEKDEEDLEEDLVDYPIDRGDNDDNESSDDDNDDDDIKKDKEDEEEEEHLAPADPSVVPIDDPVPSS
ncbi:ribonuclease H-like domain-containing protein [Tanacetum coccineum]|uniref:Ribonuclease H-like domain-containing protein n=1 Tax=Tanacetum coccineum TaxID=301880 RepID=A0ABQ5AF73_9ASTR